MYLKPNGYKMLGRIYVLIVLVACSLQATAQYVLPDLTFEERFAAHVTSMDEFMNRFNGKESKPGLANDSLSRINNIIHLFDSDIAKRTQSFDSLKKEIGDFALTVSKWEKQLSLKDSQAWGEVICKMKYKKKAIKVTLLMQLDSIGNGRSRWGIAGAKGLKEVGVYKDKLMTISPVDHETHFVSLEDFFLLNKELIPSLRSKGYVVDELSLLMGLSMAGDIQFEHVENLKFHFFEVPGYVFSVEEIGRDGYNTGWLITRFEKMDENGKTKYYKELFGVK